MIKGVGIDIVSIKRMRDSIEKHGERFLMRVFTPDEIAHCQRRKDPAPSFAARFAAKEALIKATGGRAGFELTDIEVLNDKKGKPCLNMRGILGDALKRFGAAGAHLSLSHERDFAVAFVVLEDGQP